jgi:hypothetical protein
LRAGKCSACATATSSYPRGSKRFVPSQANRSAATQQAVDAGRRFRFVGRDVARAHS